MDTVGDAYICAGFIPSSGATAGGRAEVHIHMLEAAAAMMNAVQAFNATEPIQGAGANIGPLRCRIGVSAGPVLAGVLGRLQPRYHIFGPGIRGAELCEQTGEEGAVHAR